MIGRKPRVRVPSRPGVSLPARGKPNAAYMRGETGPTFGGWRPALRESRDDVRAAWQMAASRTTEMIHNSGFIAGIVDQSTANTVGAGLRLNLKPNTDALGWTKGEGAAWARKAEARFALWSENPRECDAEARRSLSSMAMANHRGWMALGETLASFPWKRVPGGMFGTKVRLLPASRLSAHTDPTLNIFHGVRLDQFGAAIGYSLRERGDMSERTIDARDGFGRVIVAHTFDGPTGTVRGITPLAPILRICRQFDQLADATLTASIIRAVFAATIESDFPTDEMLRSLQTPQETARAGGGDAAAIDAWLDGREGWYDNTQIDLGINGRFVHLYPGQKLSFHETSAPPADYEQFAGFLLREIARCAGLTFESATGDYRQATYSSIRMASADIFPLTLQRRQNIHAPFLQACFEAWLEEDIESGGTEFPGGVDGFYANRAAACRAEWKGAGKPQADDKKTAEAHRIWKELGVITDEMICNDLGVDVEDVYDGRAREAQMRAEKGLPDYVPSGQTGIGHNGGPLLDPEESDQGDKSNA